MKPLLFVLLTAGILTGLICVLNPPVESSECTSGHTYEVKDDKIIETYVEELRNCED